MIPGRNAAGGGLSSTDDTRDTAVARAQPDRTPVVEVPVVEVKTAEMEPQSIAPWARDPGGDPWSRVLSAAAPNRRLRVLLNDCSLVKAEDDVVVLSVSAALLSAVRAKEKDLCDLLAIAWDRAVKLELRPDGAEASPPVEQPVAPTESAAAIAEHPVVKRAIELFGAKVIRVQPRKDA